MRNFSWLNTGCPNFVSKYCSMMMQERGGDGHTEIVPEFSFFQRLKCENKLWLSCAKLKFSWNQNNFLGEDLLIYK